jgi:putative cardiolipin synthase
LVSVVLLVCAGCTRLQPEPHVPEVVTAPAPAALWDDVGAVRNEPWFTILDDGPESLTWRLRSLRSATASIDVQTFLWKPDPVGLLVLAEIEAAADRGIRVRVLLDDSFTLHAQLYLRELASHSNVSIRVYNPFSNRPDSLALRQLFNLGEFARVNHRMHNKLQIVDGQAAIIGGRNIADEYFGLDTRYNFRDMEVLTFGDHVREANIEFESYWDSPWSLDLEIAFGMLREGQAGASPPTPKLAFRFDESDEQRHQAWREAAQSGHAGTARLFYDRPAGADLAHSAGPNQLAADIVEQIDRAQSEVLLISAYLIPTRELEQAIARAGQRGVRVRILTNSLGSNNHLAAHSAYRNHVRALLAAGAEIHEIRDTAANRGDYMDPPVEDKRLGLHAKLIVLDDDLVFIGSCNLDPRSLQLNTEVALLVRGESFNQSVRTALAADFDPANAWRIESERGRLIWIDDDGSTTTEPGVSFLHRLEDWFLSHLPIEAQL